MWFLYVLKCFDDSYYTGITKNLDNRLKIHNSGKGAKYTRSRRPCSFVSTSEISDSKSLALKIEYRFKRLKRNEKINQIKLGLSNFVKSQIEIILSCNI